MRQVELYSSCAASRRKHLRGNNMHATSVRTQKKLAAAMVAAGVVSAASLGAMAENRSLPVLNIDVAKTSVITDALFGLGDAVNGVASGLAWIGDGAIALPIDGSSVFGVALQNPSIGPNLLSWFFQRYVNPSVNYPWFTYPYEVKVDSIDRKSTRLNSSHVEISYA